MILVLSCVDLAVVTITHPSFIASTFYFSPGEINEAHKDSRIRISIGFVLYAMALLMVILIGLSTLVYFNGETIDSILTIVIDLSFLFLFFFHLFRLQNIYNREVKTRRRKVHALWRLPVSFFVPVHELYIQFCAY